MGQSCPSISTRSATWSSASPRWRATTAICLCRSGMSDGNVHSNYNIPVLVLGGRDQGLKGNRHLKVAKGTPLANLSLTLLDKLGVPLKSYGDSTGEIDFVSGV